jgi:vacuolar-type H+-ATPase subunit I/STV1
MDDVSTSGLEQAVRNLIIKLETLKDQLADDESDSQAVEEFKGVDMELDRAVQQVLGILRADRHQRLG